MRRILCATVALAAIHAVPADAKPGCRTRACLKRVCRSEACHARVTARMRAEGHRSDARRVVEATSYCLSGRMADGTYTRPGSAASNDYPLGTRIRLSVPAHGLRDYVVRDRIGWGTQLDLWTASCADAVAFGRRMVAFSVR